MAFRDEIERNATFVLFIVFCVIAGISETVRGFVKANAVFVIPIFIYIAVYELKQHVTDLMISIKKGE